LVPTKGGLNSLGDNRRIYACFVCLSSKANILPEESNFFAIDIIYFPSPYQSPEQIHFL